MASLGGDESVQLEKNSRQTRSGKIAKQPVTPQRRSRRTRKQTQEQVSEPDDCLQDEENNVQSDVIQEMLAEAAQGIMSTSRKQEVSQFSKMEVIDNMIPSELEYSESTVVIGDDVEVTETNEIAEHLIELATINEEEKSSSFPFGNITHSENSDGGKNENNEETSPSECVDSSLLASLVGDNANSFPSAGEDSQSKENFENSSPCLNNVIEDEENDVSSSGPAVAESLMNECESDATITNADAEMPSDEDLPQPIISQVNNKEDVSIDELLTPQISQSSEEISDDVSNRKYSDVSTKRKAVYKSDDQYNPSSPTEESDSPVEKKPKMESELKEEFKDKENERKKLPELDKFWTTVREDSTDFTGWTYLLQYVDQENDVEAAREAYDAFLQHYPYCYGYWRKYADYEKRKGDKSKCEEVFERGLKAIPLSVDLWIHYLTHVKSNFPTNEEHIRCQFERALNACGLEFRSDKLWDAYIKWETEGKRLKHIVQIYDRLLSIPTQGYNGHFDNFQDIVNSNPPYMTVSADEFKKLRAEIRESIKSKENEDQHADEADDNVRNDEEATAIKDKIIAIRRKIHKVTVAAVTARWTFEEGIKRPYFHVKPLERCQLKNWTDYLEFEIEKEDRTRILILFERCLIACALYEEFWLKLIRYLEGQNDPELIQVTRYAFERACTIHHPGKPSLHLMWSAFEECQQNYDKAAEILINIEQKSPNLLQITYRRINLERRRGDYDRCKELYEHYISTSKNKNVACSLAIKYARFYHKVLNDLDAGIEILKQTLEKDGSNTRLALQLIDLSLQRTNVNENEVVSIMDRFMSLESIDPDQSVLFAQRKVEFLEDFGSTARGLQDAQRELHAALAKANEANKKRETSSPRLKNSTSKETPSSTSPTDQTATTAYNSNTFNNYGTSANASYYGSGQQYQSYDGSGYNHWQYGSSGYSNYGQWSNYGSYY